MNTQFAAPWAFTVVLALAGAVVAQQPAKDAPKPAAASAAPVHDVDAYPLKVCPISGKDLGSMGEPVSKTYDDREVRFCCNSCPPSFEKDKAAGWSKVDQLIIKDQLPLYPLETSVVSGKKLSDAKDSKPVDFVYHNRLVRVVDEGEKAEFLKDPAKHLATLDKAVVEKQLKDYPLDTCPTSGEKLGSMGDPVNVVVGGRLVRLCCKSCLKDVRRNPMKHIQAVDAARTTPAATNDKSKK